MAYLVAVELKCFVRSCLFFNWQIWLLATVLVLAIPIAIWQALRELCDVQTKAELKVAYALSTAAMLPPFVFALWFVGALNKEFSGWEYILVAGSIGSALVLVASNALLLRRNLKANAAAEISAGVYLVGGYFPSAVFLLTFFTMEPGWNMGAYFVLAACVGYVLRIVSLMRDGTKAYRPEESSG